MDYLKYIAFALTFIYIVIEKFTKTSKDDKSDFQKATRFGRTLIILSLLALGLGILQTWTDDSKSEQSMRRAAAQRAKDSTLLAARWTFDTIKFKQLLDTSEVIIKNSMANLEKANKSLSISSALLNTAEVQQKSISQNIALTQGLNYSIPNEVPMKFLFKYELKKSVDGALINYLDSIFNSVGAFEPIKLTGLDWKKTEVIHEIVEYFKHSRLEFIKEKEPLLRLNQNISRFADDTAYLKRYDESISITYDMAQKIVFIDTGSTFFETIQERKEGVTSLLDLQGSYLYVMSSSLYGTDFDTDRVLAGVVLDFNSRRIWFDYLFAYKIDKATVKHLKARGLWTGQKLFFFQYKISAELLKGNRRTLKEPSHASAPAGMYMNRRSPIDQ